MLFPAGLSDVLLVDKANQPDITRRFIKEVAVGMHLARINHDQHRLAVSGPRLPARLLIL